MHNNNNGNCEVSFLKIKQAVINNGIARDQRNK